jgi:hypothetical protein
LAILAQDDGATSRFWGRVWRRPNAFQVDNCGLLAGQRDSDAGLGRAVPNGGGEPIAALSCFAEQRDLAAGPMLLELLRRDSMTDRHKVPVMQALHALTEWFEQDMKPRMRQPAFLIRYADDFVIGFRDERDARRVMEVIPKRFGKYGLTIHPTKTKLVRFLPRGRIGSRHPMIVQGRLIS